jgi:hypothetical protein
MIRKNEQTILIQVHGKDSIEVLHDLFEEICALEIDSGGQSPSTLVITITNDWEDESTNELKYDGTAYVNGVILEETDGNK